MPPPATPQRRASRPPAPGAVRAALPLAQPPQLATLGTTPPASAGWLAEIKFDGYRLLAAIDRGQAWLLTRSGLDWSDRLPAVRGAIARLGLHTAMLDGELVRTGRHWRLQLPPPPGGPESRTGLQPDLLRLRPAPPRRLGPAPLPPRRPQGSLAPVAHGPGGHGALQRPPRGPNRRAVSER